MAGDRAQGSGRGHLGTINRRSMPISQNLAQSPEARVKRPSLDIRPAGLPRPPHSSAVCIPLCLSNFISTTGPIILWPRAVMRNQCFQILCVPGKASYRATTWVNQHYSLPLEFYLGYPERPTLPAENLYPSHSMGCLSNPPSKSCQKFKVSATQDQTKTRRKKQSIAQLLVPAFPLTPRLRNQGNNHCLRKELVSPCLEKCT